MIIYNSNIARLVNRFVMPIDAITIYPFIFVVKDYLSEDGRRHERIHLSQQLECLLVGFYLLYAVDYLIGRVRGLDHVGAYLNIRFEQEAYTNQLNPDYQRKPFAWLGYKVCR